jgi:hypothetical protein
VSAFDLICAGMFLIVFQKAHEKTQFLVLCLFVIGTAIATIGRAFK